MQYPRQLLGIVMYVNKDLYFRLLQDKGQLMSDKERDRSVEGKIHFGGLLYPSLYKLAEEVYKKIGDQDDLFPRLPNNKNKTKTIMEEIEVILRCAMHSIILWGHEE